MKQRCPIERFLALSILALQIGAWEAAAADGPPLILAGPASQTVLQGYPAVFNVAVDGTPPFLFQWLRNGGPIPAATNSVYTLTGTGPADNNGVFSVLVTNALGSAASTNALLRIDAGILGTNTIPLVLLTNTWRYQGAGTNLGTTWRSSAYDDSSWDSGSALFYNGASPLPGPQNTLLPGIPGSLPTTYYFRTRFLQTNRTSGLGLVSFRLVASTVIDDGAVFYLNGSEAMRLGMPTSPISFSTFASRTVASAALEGPFVFPTTNLFAGDNLIAVEVHQPNAINTDAAMGLALALEITVRNPDIIPPILVDQIPAAGATVGQLSQIEVFFSEPVEGVEAADLLINGNPATDLSFGLPGQFVFSFSQPATGLVQVAWDPNHGIHDLAVTPNYFTANSWSYTLDLSAPPPPISINEFMASNKKTLHDEDGDSSDWLELYNAGNKEVSLNGWYLTDEATNLTKWRFPSVVLQGAGAKNTNSYLVVFASGKNRTALPGQMHTNFKINNSGGYLALVDPTTNIISEIGPSFPAQIQDVSYGRDVADPNLLGYFPTPTPGRQNSSSGPGFGPDVTFSQPSGTFVTNAPFLLTLSTPVSNAVIYYLIGSNAVSGSTLPGSNSFRYTNPIPIANSTLVRARAFVPGFFPGAVHTEIYIGLSTQTNIMNFVSDLPILILHNFGGGGVPSGSDQFVVLETFEPKEGQATMLGPPELAERATFHLRGSSTLGYAKGSFALEIHNELDSGRNVPLFGLPDESDWVLYAPNNFEPALMHNPLAHQLMRDLGYYSSRTRFIEVFLKDDTGPPGALIGSDYNGIYVLEEKIKIGKNRVDIGTLEPEHTHPPEVTGGYIFSIDRTAPNEQPFNAGGGGMNWIDPHYATMTNAARAPQVAYIANYFNAFGTALNGTNWTNSTLGYAAYINVGNWIDFHIHEVVTYNVDGLRLSGYLHKPRNEKLNYGPAWDYDRTQGSTDGRDINPRVWTDGSSTDFFNFLPWWGRLFRDPDFWQAWIDRYQQLRLSALANSNIIAHVDQFANIVRLAQPREEARWNIHPRQANGVGTGTYDTEMQWKKNWYSNRFDFIDKQLLVPPSLSTSGGQVLSGSTVFLTPAVELGSSVVFTLDGTDPRLPGGAVSPAAVSSRAAVAIVIANNVRIFARSLNPDHKNTTGSQAPVISSPWSGPAIATVFTTLPPLRITEIMYNPAKPPAGNTNDSDSFEYIELKNIGASPLNLNKFQLGGGVTFVFPNIVLSPQQSVVVVKDIAAFQSRYGTGILIAGAYTGNLANGGDHLVLQGGLLEPILDFDYQDNWYPATDGPGFSLVIRDETAGPGTWGLKESWRPSTVVGGSPGQDDPPPPLLPAVLVNEALTHEDLPAVDAIELYNPTGGPADISGWFLSDSFGNPKKFAISTNTIIPSGDYVVFYATNSFDANGTNSFGLSTKGDQVYLFSGDGTNLTGYVHGFDFGGAENGVSFGRYLTSDGDEHFVAQSANTFGSANAYPKVGPVVISEIMYRPPPLKVGVNKVNNLSDEFIELQNTGDAPALLYDENFPTNSWRFRDAVDFDFPTNAVIPAHGFALVVSFDPADSAALAGFKARSGAADAVPIFGPFIGELSNTGAKVELYKPDAPLAPPSLDAGFVPYILVDKVNYSSGSPWPSAANGFGASLQRFSVTGFGNDFTNWVAAVRTPGAPYGGGLPPSITLNPASHSAVAETATTFTVAASGTGPFSYQWHFNGDDILGATSDTLTLTNLQPGSAGQYDAFVLNQAGFASSSSASLTIRLPVSILAQPQSVSVRLTNLTAMLTTNINFTITPQGDLPRSFQWRFNGVDIPGATNQSYTLTSVSTNAHGQYQVLLSDSTKSVLSAAANLTVLVAPLITQPLPSQPISLLQGDSITYSVSVSGFPPPFSYLWRRVNVGSSIVLTNNILNATISTLALTNLQPSNSGIYRVVVTNLASLPGGLNPVSTNTLTVSVLKLDHLSIGPGPATIDFTALSNRTYSLQFKESLTQGKWTKLADVPASSSNGVERWVDPFPPTAQRLYRLAAPRLPDVPGPVILMSPQPVRANVGDDAHFDIFAVGTGLLGYQWRFNDNDISGATASNLPLTQLQFTNAGSYAVLVSDSQGSQLSNPAILALRPVITSQPQNQAVAAGSGATFTVVADGNPPFTYRWRHYHKLIDGGTNSLLTVGNVGPADAGDYSVTVIHQTTLGPLSVVSSNAVLRLLP